ncbi:MAG: hypothetical protein DRP84_01430 [Spirochaetes bacterium]|nr:MAG: hypothetical protein DRP84_01430 [Spirochaetota bacterium]
MIDLSVIVPCYNEEDNIQPFVLKILEVLNQYSIKGEIILINDGSADKTEDIIERLSREFDNVLKINHQVNLGITESWYSGLVKSNGQYVVTIDADFQYNPNDINILYSEIIKGDCDLVQGWRREYKDNKAIRKLLSRALSGILNGLFFLKINDIKSGFVIYKRNVFFDILGERKKYFTFQHFFIICAVKKGYVLKQVPIEFSPRLHGKSFIKNPLFFSCKVILDMPRALLNFGFVGRKKKKERT